MASRRCSAERWSGCGWTAFSPTHVAAAFFIARSPACSCPPAGRSKKQGSSDLRQTQTTATKNWDGTYSLVGHNWFFSVPHSGVFLTLARTEEGVSCFVVAGLLPDGTRNRPRIQRLKVSLNLVGEPGHGICEGLEMNQYTRLDFAVGSAGVMRWRRPLIIRLGGAPFRRR